MFCATAQKQQWVLLQDLGCGSTVFSRTYKIVSSLDREHFKTFHNLQYVCLKTTLKCFGQANVSEPEVSAPPRNFLIRMPFNPSVTKCLISVYSDIFFLLGSDAQWSSGLALGLRIKGSGVWTAVSILGFQRQYCLLLPSRYITEIRVLLQKEM